MCGRQTNQVFACDSSQNQRRIFTFTGTIRHFVVKIRNAISLSFSVMDCAASRQETTQICQVADRLCMVESV